MDVMQTITKPWREPMDYLNLVFWFVIFLIAAGIVYDMLRILSSWVKNVAS